MHAAACYFPHSSVYPSLLSYATQCTQQYFSDSRSINTLPAAEYALGVESTASHSIAADKRLETLDGEADHQWSPDDSSMTDSDNVSLPLKKRSRTIPVEQKDSAYFEKRARNNESAKRSRDTRRVKEQDIQERVTFLEYENSRIAMENQAIRYQLSQLHALCGGASKS